MSFRASEASARPQAVDSARQLVELIGKTANAWPTIKPWLNETDIKGLTEQVNLLCCPPAILVLSISSVTTEAEMLIPPRCSA